MTERQLLWRVELPLAVPEIIAGLRIATVSTVAIATLAFFAGAGGLGDPLIQQLQFKTNIIICGGLAILMAVALDGLLIVAQRLVTPWRRARAYDVFAPPLGLLHSFTGAIDFISTSASPTGGGEVMVARPRSGT